MSTKSFDPISLGTSGSMSTMQSRMAAQNEEDEIRGATISANALVIRELVSGEVSVKNGLTDFHYCKPNSPEYKARTVLLWVLESPVNRLASLGVVMHNTYQAQPGQPEIDFPHLLSQLDEHFHAPFRDDKARLYGLPVSELTPMSVQLMCMRIAGHAIMLCQNRQQATIPANWCKFLTPQGGVVFLLMIQTMVHRRISIERWLPMGTYSNVPVVPAPVRATGPNTTTEARAPRDIE